MTALLVLGTLVPVGLLVVYVAAPGRRDQLLAEDRFLENSTAILYVIAAILSLAILVVRRSKAGGAPALVLAASLFAAAEEVSYGERAAGFVPPEISGYKMDTAHDVFFLALKTIKDLYQTRGPVVGMAVVAAVGGVGWVMASTRHRWIPRLERAAEHPSIVCLLFAVATGVVTLVLDAVAGGSEIVQLLEESLEATAALYVLLAAVLLWPSLDMEQAASGR